MCATEHSSHQSPQAQFKEQETEAQLGTALATKWVAPSRQHDEPWLSVSVLQSLLSSLGDEGLRSGRV